MDESHETGGADGLLREAISRGDHAAAVERLLGAAMGENDWEREQAYAAARRLLPVGPLLPPLERALRAQQDAELRNAARSVLAQLAHSDSADAGAALELLTRLAAHDSDVDVRILAVNSLGESRNPEARLPLEAALTDANPNVAAAAADGLGLLRDSRSIDPLVRTVGRESTWVRVAAVVALGEIGDPTALSVLGAALHDPLLSGAAAGAIAAVRDPAGLDLLDPLLVDDHPAREAAVEAASSILTAHPDAVPSARLREILAERVDELRHRLLDSGDEAAALLLGAAGTPAAAHALVEALSRHQPAAAAAGLGRLPDDVVETAVLQTLDSLEPEQLVFALGSLARLTSEAAVERVVALLGSPEPDVQRAAAELLGRTGDDLAAPALIEALRKSELRYGAARALGMMGSARCSPLTELLDDPEVRVRQAAAEGLARCATTEVRDRIVAALGRESDPSTQICLMEAVGMAGGDDAVTVLAPLLEDPNAEIRFTACRALGHTGSTSAVAPLIQVLGDPSPEIRGAALQALGELGDATAARAVAPFLDAANPDLRYAAATVLRRIPTGLVVDRLIGALSDPSWAVRQAAARALQRSGDPSALAPLRAVAEADPDPMVRRAAREAADAQTSPSGTGGGV